MRLIQFELRNFEYVSQKSVIAIFAEYLWWHQQTLKITNGLLFFFAIIVSNNHVSVKLLSYRTVFEILLWKISA
jgi:hypothetical protein